MNNLTKMINQYCYKIYHTYKNVEEGYLLIL